MRHRRSILLSSTALVIIALATVAAGRQAVAGEEYVGTWTGTFTGNDTGTLEITMAKDAAGAIVATLVITSEPGYTVTFKTLQFDGNRMKGTYPVPPDGLLEMSVTGTFETATASGTWSARDTVGGGEMGAGTWMLTKKP